MDNTLRLATMGLCIKDLYLSADSNPGEGEIDPKNENTDVIVLVETCDPPQKTTKYAASFFSYDNINELKLQHFKTGEYMKGKYFFSKNMLLIDDCSIENVRTVVKHLIDEGEFVEVFQKITE